MWEEIAWTFEFPISTDFTITCTVSVWQVPSCLQGQLQFFSFSLFACCSPSPLLYCILLRQRGRDVQSVSLGAHLSTSLYSRSEIHVATSCLSFWIIHLYCVWHNLMLLFTYCKIALIWFNFKDRFRNTDAPPLTYYPGIYHSITPMFYVSREQVYTHCISPVLCAFPPPIVSFRWSRADRCRVFHHVWLKG